MDPPYGGMVGQRNHDVGTHEGSVCILLISSKSSV